MRRELIVLIEAVRDLGLSRVPDSVSAGGILIRGDRETIPQKFETLLTALEAYDRASGIGHEDGASEERAPHEQGTMASASSKLDEDPTMNPALLREALKGLVGMIKEAGLDIGKAHDIVAEVLMKDAKTPKAGFAPRPSFAGKGKGEKWKPMTELIPPSHAKTSMPGLAMREHRAEMVDRLLTGAAPGKG